MKCNKATIIVLFSILASGMAQAFNVDKMVIVADKKGNGVVTLKNDGESPIFVKSQVQEIKVDSNNNILRTEYERSNLSDWKISLTYSTLALKPGEEKDIGIRSLCRNTSCDETKDLMFMLPFTPSKYQVNDELKSGVDINYGFTPIYIIPTKYPKYDYEIYNQGDTLRINNKSNTMINVFVDMCSKINKVNCKQKFTAISGRDKTFDLPKILQGPSIDVNVSSYDKRYSTKEKLIKN
ncbi:hypothetical protein ERW51_08590 [Aliivibrio finisterrensis]|uniref:hypothetical protein n=1 Tax=Aliivibrio finisterrensis TaxID=511998 RepID=UPI00101F42C5|nr:hypothetical protein [Aliivibrio finisterrensis]RYU68416.1 hypothetical protein ERW54_08785 [Aliivibrio finisterrensis]RYU72168.1 hypothetical protein ERW51_08590 [Aliivibrio finisterrensis]RYU75684.1 hypothetical protein ERW48_07535 [Aliivibrio finisterrensis]